MQSRQPDARCCASNERRENIMTSGASKRHEQSGPSNGQFVSKSSLNDMYHLRRVTSSSVPLTRLPAKTFRLANGNPLFTPKHSIRCVIFYDTLAQLSSSPRELQSQWLLPRENGCHELIFLCRGNFGESFDKQSTSKDVTEVNYTIDSVIQTRVSSRE